MSRKNRKSGLLLSPAVFGKLHDALLNKLKESYKVAPKTMVDYQVYGFSDYDGDLPSIKKMIIDITGNWVNGKYLYNKYREWKKGVSPIKMTREFVFIYFKILGYHDVNDFIQNASFSEDEILEQSKLERDIVAILQNEYYVGYYCGEEGNLIATRLTLFQESLKVQWALAYWEKVESFSEYIYNGTILIQQNGMSLLFKNEENDLDRSQFVSIFCEPYTKVKPVLVGAYSGYDRNRQPVVGEVVFQRVNSVEEQMEIIQKKNVNSIIAQYLSGRRWKTLGKTLQNITGLSPQSKFAEIIENFIQVYRGIFVSIEDGVFVFELTIHDNLGNATLNIAGHPIYSGIMKVQASGQLLIGQFTNDTTRAPLSMSIEVLPIRKRLYTGDLLGVSRFDKSFSGKVYISSNSMINDALPSYRGAELTPAEIVNLPKDILNDLTTTVNNNKLKEQFQIIDSENTKNYLSYLAGEYEMIYKSKAQQRKYVQLIIENNGKSSLIDQHLNYEGHAMMCEGGVMSIYFTHCNGIPNCGQLICRTGKKDKKDLNQIEGTWIYLNAELKAESIKVTVLPI